MQVVCKAPRFDAISHVTVKYSTVDNAHTKDGEEEGEKGGDVCRGNAPTGYLVLTAGDRKQGKTKKEK